MRRKLQSRRSCGATTKLAAFSVILILSFFSRQLTVIEAQSRLRDTEYDYYALALASTLNSASEASKLPDIPHKVELILQATAMLSESDEQRTFETLSTAARYANSSEYKVSPPLKPAFAFGLDASIGEAQTKLGVFPESLSELKIDSSLSALATTDWFRVDSIVNEFREPSLRLRLKLQFAGAVLARESKLR